MHTERRRYPRIEILNRIHGHVTAFDVFVTVRDMSLGGMSLETSFAFPEGASHEFRLTLGDAAVVINGRILRCREHIRSDGGRVYISGIEFTGEAPSAAVAAMIEKVK
jgi:hypothetical protein